MKLFQKKKEEPQFEMGLKDPFVNRFYKLKARIHKLFLIIETKRFFKSSTVWFYMISLILLNILLFNYFEYFLNRIPSEVPLFQQSLELSKRLVSKDLIKYIPVTVAFLSLVGLIISSRIYNKKNYLAIVILLVEVLSVSTILYNVVSIISRYI